MEKEKVEKERERLRVITRTEAEHREYTNALMKECRDDAEYRFTINSTACAIYATALFQSRVKHLHYWQKGE